VIRSEAFRLVREDVTNTVIKKLTVVYMVWLYIWPYKLNIWYN